MRSQCRLLLQACLPSTRRLRSFLRSSYHSPAYSRQPQTFKTRRYDVLETIRTAPADYSASETFTKYVHRWATSPVAWNRLLSFGIPRSDAGKLLDTFAAQVERGQLSRTAMDRETYQLSRFSHQNTPISRSMHLDRIYTNILFRWSTSPATQSYLANSEQISSNTLKTLTCIAESADMSFPADWFHSARRLKRRFIMHVGPTNSGKTHNALCALAAAPRGVYAGPLRLLAHEIFERLNRGQIIPHGVTPGPDTQPDTDIVADISDGNTQTVSKIGNQKYARKCNLLTGEERRVVSEDPDTLLSCTVEMLDPSMKYDVAVIDEIQLLADPERGGAWTAAVLGVSADEIHLCGEAAAVPLVQTLLRRTGDELEVKHYERLTPLEVEKHSLQGDLGNVRKGDCIVCFSRSGIFGLKKEVEEKTGLRCAVVYGRLPPEVRGNQAALFNDPNSGYDVLIGSDAIGMGLNLKIKRIVFETVQKFNGRLKVPLPLSQVKQIAGRAGRFGLHGSSPPVGLVTTLHEKDLAAVHVALVAPPPKITHAYVPLTLELFSRACAAFPPDAELQAVFTAFTHVGNLPPQCAFEENKSSKFSGVDNVFSFIDRNCVGMTAEERMLILRSPMQWRDAESVVIAKNFIAMYRNDYHVDIHRALEGSQHIARLESVEAMMNAENADQESALLEKGLSVSLGLQSLEALHKVLVSYLWMWMRAPVAYRDVELVTDLKTRTEVALNWCLTKASWGQAKYQKSNDHIQDEMVVGKIQKPRALHSEALSTA